LNRPDPFPCQMAPKPGHYTKWAKKSDCCPMFVTPVYVDIGNRSIYQTVQFFG